MPRTLLLGPYLPRPCAWRTCDARMKDRPSRSLARRIECTPWPRTCCMLISAGSVRGIGGQPPGTTHLLVVPRSKSLERVEIAFVRIVSGTQRQREIVHVHGLRLLRVLEVAVHCVKQRIEIPSERSDRYLKARSATLTARPGRGRLLRTWDPC